MFDFISKYNCYELSDKVSMKSFFVLCVSSRKAQIIFDVIDISFNGSELQEEKEYRYVQLCNCSISKFADGRLCGMRIKTAYIN